ncbi:hypothetical protein BN000_03373 [Neobacillus massiliamazoniensis]|uniref:Uncharacterized protein n=1 Tax=Neobacillus massiliamazoniensis TaxID=1499688 RepID=A0A0U1NZH8_9BACI|nr:hypothetical protein BN000_03373 [Neobacillus massiliamazoniensis]
MLRDISTMSPLFEGEPGTLFNINHEKVNCLEIRLTILDGTQMKQLGYDF